MEPAQLNPTSAHAGSPIHVQTAALDTTVIKNDEAWREESDLLTQKSDLPVLQLRFGDTESYIERGYHTLGNSSVTE